MYLALWESDSFSVKRWMKVRRLLICLNVQFVTFLNWIFLIVAGFTTDLRQALNLKECFPQY